MSISILLKALRYSTPRIFVTTFLTRKCPKCLLAKGAITLVNKLVKLARAAWSLLHNGVGVFAFINAFRLMFAPLRIAWHMPPRRANAAPNTFYLQNFKATLGPGVV